LIPLLDNRNDIPYIGSMRQDARRNLERVFNAAKHSFAAHGGAVTMEEVARLAGVGVGTLYRRFGNRAGLVEAVYADAIEQISHEAAELVVHSNPWEALSRWCAAYVDVLATKRSLLAELTPLFEQRPDLLDGQRQHAHATLAGLLERAQVAGVALPDVTAAEVIALLNATMRSNAAGDRLLAIVLAGIRKEQRP
jgi:AcrR family transcriptional regulator